MQVIKTKLDGVLIIDPKVFPDQRGFFFESYNEREFAKHGITTKFVQDNHSASIKGTIRGMHFQKGAAAQTKLVRCLQGKIYDVAVDLRRASPTFKQWVGCELTADNKRMLYIPKGFAHGFLVISDYAEFAYKCDNFYDPAAEAGIIWNDPELGIDWHLDDPIISPKDQKLPLLSQIQDASFF